MSAQDINDWNRISETYTQFAGPDDPVNRYFQPVFWDSLGNVQGKQILDLGCGDGWLSQMMADAGAEVVGIDGSAALVQKAINAYPDIEFQVHDLSQGLPAYEQRFDFVVANMVLQDIPDLTALMRSVRDVMLVGSKLIFTMPHPCFFNMKTQQDEEGEYYKKVTGYLEDEVWRIETFGGHNHYHRSLTAYFDLLRQNRMAVTRLYEPAPQPRSDIDRPAEQLAFIRSMPSFIFFEALAI